MPSKSQKPPRSVPKKAVKKNVVKKASAKSAKKSAPPVSQSKKPVAAPKKIKKTTGVAAKGKIARKSPKTTQKGRKPTAQSSKPGAQPAVVIVSKKKIHVVPAGFLAKQRIRLLTLKDTLLDSMSVVAKDSLRSRADGNEASAFGMHQADAGSDAYDRDLALSLLSQEKDSLYEIDEALKRIETGTYGICEMSGKPILHARLEALPFARYTVECQAEIEKKNRFSRVRQPVTSLFGLGDDEGDDDDETSNDSKD